jgi:hypothetical protein
MEHQVRVSDVVVAAAEAAALEVIGGADARAPEQPLGAHAEFAHPRDVRVHGHRLPARELHVHLEVVLQVRADTRQVRDRRDAARVQQAGRADAGELQQLRRVDRPAAQDDFAGAHRLRTAPARVYSTPTARGPSNTTRVAGTVFSP